MILRDYQQEDEVMLNSVMTKEKRVGKIIG
jgi:hypothetical protein